MTAPSEMLEFINTDPETGKAFQKLIRLIQRKNCGTSTVTETREKVLKEMIKADCYGQPERLHYFITGHSLSLKGVRPLFRCKV